MTYSCLSITFFANVWLLLSLSSSGKLQLERKTNVKDMIVGKWVIQGHPEVVLEFNGDGTFAFAVNSNLEYKGSFKCFDSTEDIGFTDIVNSEGKKLDL